MSTFFLAEKVEHYFLLNNIKASFNDDVMTGHKQDEPEEILKWNVDKLGPQPTYEQIDEASAIYSAQLAIEQLWNSVRDRRSDLLTQSDILVLPDRWVTYTEQKQNALSTYRQALRDITTQSDPSSIVWPTLPT